MWNWLSLREEEVTALALSLKVSMAAVVVSLPLAVIIGWFLARRQFRGKTIVETLFTLPLVLPPVVVGYLLLIAFGRRGFIGRFLDEWLDVRIAFTWWGAALAAGVVGFPLLLRSVRIGFASVDPRLELMARSLGAGRLRTFWTVSIPLAMSAILSGAVLAFARGWGEFGATIMIAGNIAGQTRTVPLAVYGSLESPGAVNQTWRLVVISVVVAWVALALSEWLIRRGGRSETGKAT